MSSSRIFYGNSRVRQTDVIPTYGKNHAYSLKLSPGGKFIAVGNDVGLLEIYSLSNSTFNRIGVYDTGASIRAIVWHPLEPAVVFCGSTNGCIHRITVVSQGANHICDGVVPGYIHLLQISQDGRKLAIGHGRSVSVVNDPFTVPNELGTLISLHIPLSNTIQSLSEYQLARGIFFLSSRIILVAFFGREGITAYSAVDHSPQWNIRLREGTFMGSIAISPSGERLAVMNLTDGIDFYSTTHRRLLSSTHYILSERTPPRNLVVEIVFIDEDTVAFGHSDGYVAFATFGINEISPARAFEDDGDNYSAPIQTITFGFINRNPSILSVVPRSDPWAPLVDQDGLAVDILIGVVDNDDEMGLVPNVRPIAPPPMDTPDTVPSVNTLHLTPFQALIFFLVTIIGTLYVQSQLMRKPRASSVTVTTALSSPTAVPQVELPSQSIIESSTTSISAYGQPFYAFTLTGTVAGSASIALPTKEPDSA